MELGRQNCFGCCKGIEPLTIDTITYISIISLLERNIKKEGGSRIEDEKIGSHKFSF